MNILVINSGSSSVKFQVFEMPGEKLLMKGKAMINEHGDTDFYFNTDGWNSTVLIKQFSYPVIFQTIFDKMVLPESKCLSSLNELDVVGHRLIHGGEKSGGCELISEKLISWMKGSLWLAPLHYPANLEGIRAVQKYLPDILQAGVFDTSFHSSMPPRAFLYGISPAWNKKHRIRRYGFHGISHKYASHKACNLTGLSIEKSRIISCHLGNGASMAAVKNGKSIDTSMGLTPVEGLVMGSRCGDIDAGILTYLMKNYKFSAARIQNLINNEGGLLGLSGVSSDYRAVEEAADKGNMWAHTALDVYHYRVRKYIGAYAAALEGIDALVFTGGIGENSSRARAEICKGLQFLGINPDAGKNENPGAQDAVISQLNSPVAVAVVAANEELEIAREVAAFVNFDDYRQ